MPRPPEGAAGEPEGEDRDATGSWVARWLAEGERVEEVVPLLGGWTSRMRRLDLRGPGGHRRSLVLRSFVKPFYVSGTRKGC